MKVEVVSGHSNMGPEMHCHEHGTSEASSRREECESGTSRTRVPSHCSGCVFLSGNFLFRVLYGDEPTQQTGQVSQSVSRLAV
jgi:hypothetical protein